MSGGSDTIGGQTFTAASLGACGWLHNGPVCFALAAFGMVASQRVNLLALGLLAWVLVPLVALINAG